MLCAEVDGALRRWCWEMSIPQMGCCTRMELMMAKLSNRSIGTTVVELRSRDNQYDVLCMWND